MSFCKFLRAADFKKRLDACSIVFPRILSRRWMRLIAGQESRSREAGNEAQKDFLQFDSPLKQLTPPPSAIPLPGQPAHYGELVLAPLGASGNVTVQEEFSESLV